MKQNKADIFVYRTELMGLSALCIYIFHEWVPLAPNVPILGFIEGFIKQIGFFGVDIFFLLSGMGLIHAIEKHSLSAFYKRRLLRVLPPYIIMAIVIMFVQKWSFPQFLKNLFGITFLTENMYSLLWFVPAITIFYLVFPLYYTIFKKMGNKIFFTGAMLLLWLITSLLAAGHMRLDLFGFTNRIPIFLVGILLGWLIKEKTMKISKWMWGILLSVFIFGLITAYLTNYRGMYLLVPVSNCCVPNFCMAISGAFLFTKGMNLLERYGKTLGKIFLRSLSFFGAMSLEFYCVQELIGEKIKAFFIGKTWDSITNLLMLLGVTASAFLLHFVCTRLQNTFKRQKD